MQERRSEPRFLCSDLVQILVHAENSQSHELTVNLEEISSSGACLLAEAVIAAGADLEIICSKCRFRGKVKYCRYDPTGYFVGVEFDERKSWNRGKFKPRHFLEVPVMGDPTKGAGETTGG